MKTYNDNNIKTILSLIKKNKKSMANLIRRGNKLNINKNEVINSIELLLDLELIKEKEEMIGDGWNSSDTAKYYSLV